MTTTTTTTTTTEPPAVQAAGYGDANTPAREASPEFRPPSAVVTKLGEELPVFCERCGYSLHGLAQSRCETCSLLHFVCPECNHHQPINTLRPAVQRLVGRIQAAFLVIVVLFKLNWFGWLLFAWFAMGVEWSYSYNYRRTIGASSSPQALVHAPRPVDYEAMLAFGLFALAFGLLSRLLLLRWRRGAMVGLTLGLLAAGLALAGARFRASFAYSQPVGNLSLGFYTLLVITLGCAVLGASIAWPLWATLVRAFVPRTSAQALLEWQRAQSAAIPDPHASRHLDAPNPA